jgi:hypothetical protein
MRIDIIERARVVSRKTRNQLFRSRKDGGWDPVTDEQPLDARHRGLVWEAWKLARADQQFHAFRGARAVDSTVQILLRGLLLHDVTGDPIADPLTAGRVFLLSSDHAKTFLLRVEEAGGEVYRADLTPAGASQHLEHGHELVQEMQVLISADRQAVTEARNRDFSGAAAFARRREDLQALFGAIRSVRDDGERALSAVIDTGDLKARAHARGLQAQLRAAYETAGLLLEEHEDASVELERWVAFANGHGPAPNNDKGTAVFTVLEQLLRDAGEEVNRTPEGVRVRTKAGWLRIGPGIAIE